MTESEAVQLERRLSKIEAAIMASAIVGDELKQQLTNHRSEMLDEFRILSARMVQHFESDESWMNAHDKAQARADGYRSGQLAVVGIVVTIASLASGAIVKLVLG